MLRMAVAQWRVRARRSLALLSMIAVAVAGFTLLTAAAVTSRLDAVGTVTANYRPGHDIQAMGEVSVAAPVAVIGYVMRTVPITVDLSDDLDPALRRQLLRVQPT